MSAELSHFVCTKTDIHVYEKLLNRKVVEALTFPRQTPSFFFQRCSRSHLPPWFLCNMRKEWSAGLWPWCQTGGRGTASDGPGCTSGAPRNTCAHPSSRAALLITHTHTHTHQSGHSQRMCSYCNSYRQSMNQVKANVFFCSTVALVCILF